MDGGRKNFPMEISSKETIEKDCLMVQESIFGRMVRYMKDNFVKVFELEKVPSKTKEDLISKEIF